MSDKPQVANSILVQAVKELQDDVSRLMQELAEAHAVISGCAEGLEEPVPARLPARIKELQFALAAARKEVDLARKLFWLVAHDHIFFGSYNPDTNNWDEGAYPAVNCNDVFVAGADAENLPLNEVDTLIAVCKKFPHGPILWCIAKRNEKPWRLNYDETHIEEVRAMIDSARGAG